MLASRLASRFEGSGDYSDADYSWLQALLARSKTERWEDLGTLVDRMLDFANRRSDSVAFLTQLVTSPNSALPVRIAAYGAFEDPRMFNFEAPDADSRQIFETCTLMLKDREPEIRAANAALLHNVSMRINPASAPGYIERSRTAIAEALAAEGDLVARQQLGHYLELIVK